MYNNCDLEDKKCSNKVVLFELAEAKRDRAKNNKLVQRFEDRLLQDVQQKAT